MYRVKLVKTKTGAVKVTISIVENRSLVVRLGSGISLYRVLLLSRGLEKDKELDDIGVGFAKRDAAGSTDVGSASLRGNVSITGPRKRGRLDFYVDNFIRGAMEVRTDKVGGACQVERRF